MNNDIAFYDIRSNTKLHLKIQKLEILAVNRASKKVRVMSFLRSCLVDIDQRRSQIWNKTKKKKFDQTHPDRPLRLFFNDGKTGLDTFKEPFNFFHYQAIEYLG